MKPNRLFLYGTLMPGEERWPLLEPYVAGTEPDTTRGFLFETEFAYPAARFDGTNSIGDKIHGLVVTFDPDLIDECLEFIDEVEAAEAGLYHRVIVETGNGEKAWSYQYGTGLTHLVRIRSGSWLQHTSGELPSTAPPGAILDEVEARVIGAMIEKAMATPQSYPLSMNAVLAACNQKSSRDPVTDFDETTVMNMLTAGKERKLVRFVHPTSGHGVTKYRHVFDEFLGIDEAATAILGVLMLRGAQTARELRDRTERMYAFDGTDGVVEVLEKLADDGHVVQLHRQPGQRDDRWLELLTGSPE